MPRAISRSCLECAVRGGDCFCTLEDDALRTLEDLGEHVEVPQGTQIFREGFDPEKVFIVCKGQVKLTVTSKDGRLLILRIAAPGDVLGLAAALRHKQYEASAVAIEPCQLKWMMRADFFEFMKQFSEVGENSARSLAEEYRTTVMSARRLALSGSAGGKLASVLLEWAHRASLNKTQLKFVMPLTHEELASMAGISRETTTRMLTKFKNDGLIAIHGSTIVIEDEAGMEQMFS